MMVSNDSMLFTARLIYLSAVFRLVLFICSCLVAAGNICFVFFQVLDEFNRPHHDEKVIGYADIKSDPVFFHVTKKRRFFSTGQKVLFDNVVLNIGEAMDIGSGIFTAPRSGKYSFNFNGFKDALVGELCVVLKLNGQTDLASSYVGNANDRASQLAPIALHVITSLKANDQVSLYLKEGSIAGSSHGNNFSGFLIHQDLTFE